MPHRMFLVRTGLTETIRDVGNCISLYLCDDLSGRMVDQMGVNVGSYVGGPILGKPPLQRAERASVNYASGKYASCKSGALVAGLVNSTLIVSIKSGAWTGSTNAVYCERGSSGNDIWKLVQIDSTHLRFVHRDDAGTLTNGGNETTASCDGVPRVVGIAKASKGIIYYRDGLANGTQALAGGDTMTNATLEARIGSDKGDGTCPWTSLIGFVALFGKTLAPAEMMAVNKAARGQ